MTSTPTNEQGGSPPTTTQEYRGPLIVCGTMPARRRELPNEADAVTEGTRAPHNTPSSDEEHNENIPGYPRDYSRPATGYGNDRDFDNRQDTEAFPKFDNRVSQEMLERNFGTSDQAFTRQGEEIDYGRASYLGYIKGPSPDKPTQSGKTMPTQDARNMPEYAGRQYGMGTTAYAGGPATPAYGTGTTMYVGGPTQTFAQGTTYYAGGPTPGYGPGDRAATFDMSGPPFDAYAPYRYNPGPPAPYGCYDPETGYPLRDVSAYYQARGYSQRGGPSANDFVGDAPIRVNKRHGRGRMAPPAVSPAEWEIPEGLKQAWRAHLDKQKKEAEAGTASKEKEVGGLDSGGASK